MRALGSIVARAGALRQTLDLPEDAIVLSAINDVNLPKFTANDIPLFQGICHDLFPTTELPPPEYGTLRAAIDAASTGAGLQPETSFVQSVLQLYETIQVRHGLMLVGETGSGKTTVLHTLATALNALAATSGGAKVHTHTLNPKSITAGQLYGSFDEVSAAA
jgi:dynein heavy chain